MHHHVEQIIVTCLESKNATLIQHLLHECNLVGKILEAEKNFTLATDSNKVVVCSIIVQLFILLWAPLTFPPFLM